MLCCSWEQVTVEDLTLESQGLEAFPVSLVPRGPWAGSWPMQGLYHGTPPPSALPPCTTADSRVRGWGAVVREAFLEGAC